MKPEVRKLLDRIDSEDLIIKEEAILSLALLFEKNSLLCSNEEFYQSNLEPNLYSVGLNEAEKDEIVDYIKSQVIPKNISSSLIWALGKPLTLNSFKVLLEILTRQLVKNNEDALWQTLIGIENILSGDKTHSIYFQARELINEKEVEAIREAGNSNNLQIVQIVKRIQKLIPIDTNQL